MSLKQQCERKKVAAHNNIATVKLIVIASQGLEKKEFKDFKLAFFKFDSGLIGDCIFSREKG